MQNSIQIILDEMKTGEQRDSHEIINELETRFTDAFNDFFPSRSTNIKNSLITRLIIGNISRVKRVGNKKSLNTHGKLTNNAVWEKI